MWNIMDEGKTIGTYGPENGIIIKDEQFDDSARITMENCERYYAITCGVYGDMVHTAFCNEDDKDTKYENMKKDLQEFLLKETIEQNEKEKFYDYFCDEY